MQYVKKFFCYNFFNQYFLLNMQNPKMNLVNGLCGYTNSSQVVIIMIQNKQSSQKFNQAELR